MKENMKMIAFGLAGIVLIGGIRYGSYWIAKTVSYSFFYESMVEQTVREMVKPEYLKKITKR